MNTQDIGFVGGGRITRILLEAMDRRGLPLTGIRVSDASQAVRDTLQNRFPAIEVDDDNRHPAEQPLVFLALHPPLCKEVLPGLGQALQSDSTLVSLAPMLFFAMIEELTGGHRQIVRMIPNVPSLVHRGYNPVSFAPGFPEEDRQAFHAFLDTFGQHPEVDAEKLEAYAILTAMGPTYFWFQWQKLRDLGRSFGLSPQEVDAGLEAMITGGASLLFGSGLSFADVEDTVPVKPLAAETAKIEEIYADKLGALFKKLTG